MYVCCSLCVCIHIYQIYKTNKLRQQNPIYIDAWWWNLSTVHEDVLKNSVHKQCSRTASEQGVHEQVSIVQVYFILLPKTGWWAGPCLGFPLNGHCKQYILVDTIFKYICYVGLSGTCLYLSSRNTPFWHWRSQRYFVRTCRRHFPGSPKWKM